MDVQTATEDVRFDAWRSSRSTWTQDWLGNVRGDLLAGLVVALALIPEAIAFSIIAGVDPQVGLFASVVIAITIAFVGGRPGMISAATGAMALVMIDLVKDHGLAYVFAAALLTGVIQILFGWRKLGRYMKFVPRPVMVGFVNALAILIFMAQLPQLAGGGWLVWGFVAAGWRSTASRARCRRLRRTEPMRPSGRRAPPVRPVPHERSPRLTARTALRIHASVLRHRGDL